MCLYIGIPSSYHRHLKETTPWLGTRIANRVRPSSRSFPAPYSTCNCYFPLPLTSCTTVRRRQPRREEKPKPPPESSLAFLVHQHRRSPPTNNSRETVSIRPPAVLRTPPPNSFPPPPSFLGNPVSLVIFIYFFSILISAWFCRWGLPRSTATPVGAAASAATAGYRTARSARSAELHV